MQNNMNNGFIQHYTIRRVQHIRSKQHGNNISCLRPQADYNCEL